MEQEGEGMRHGDRRESVVKVLIFLFIFYKFSLSTPMASGEREREA